MSFSKAESTTKTSRAIMMEADKTSIACEVNILFVGQVTL